MKKLLLIAKREYIATVTSKAFLVGLIALPLFMGGSVIAMALFKDKVDIRDKKIAIIDQSEVVAEGIIEAAEERNSEKIHNKQGEQTKPAYLFHTVDLAGRSLDEVRLKLSDQVRNKKLFGFVEIGPGLLEKGAEKDELFVRFYSKNPALDDLRGWLREPLNARVRSLKMDQAGIESELKGYLFKYHGVEGMKLVTRNEAGDAEEAKKANELEAFGVPVIFMFLIFIMVMTGAMPLLNSVMEEKGQHIAETLLCSVTPFQFMFGKVLGGVAVSLTGSALYIVGVIFMLGNMGMMGQVPFGLLPWFLIYLVIAIIMMGSIMASVGAACSDVKESQNLVFPAMIPIMVPMFVMMPVLKEPMSGFATTLSLVPPFTPMLMLLRQAVPGGVPMWQPLLGLALLILFTVFVIWVGSRVFRVGILLKGKTPGFITLIKWALKG